jgi:ubiquinone/menaquinone biosynthesis C-methylase UbiE
LDVGCGGGDHAAYMASKGFKVTGVDMSPGMLEWAHKRHKNVEFIEKDMTDLQFPPESFQAIFCSYSFFHIPPEQVTHFKALFSHSYLFLD